MHHTKPCPDYGPIMSLEPGPILTANVFLPCPKPHGSTLGLRELYFGEASLSWRNNTVLLRYIVRAQPESDLSSCHHNGAVQNDQLVLLRDHCGHRLWWHSER